MLQWKFEATILVCTYNRSELLRQTLESLFECEGYADGLFEIIVCDDGSSDDSLSIVQRYGHFGHLRYLFQPDLGYRPSAARNMGIQCAAGRIVVFLDAGVIVDPKLAVRHARLHSKNSDRYVVLGITHGYETRDSLDGDLAFGDLSEIKIGDGIADRRLQVPEFISNNLHSLVSPWTLCWGNNLSVTRKALMDVGLFNEHFRSWGYEDLDLGLRLFISGRRFIVDLEAKTFHIAHDKDSHIELQVLENIRLLYTGHPGLETELLASFDTIHYSARLSHLLAFLKREEEADTPYDLSASTEEWFANEELGRAIVECDWSGALCRLLSPAVVLHPSASKVRKLMKTFSASLFFVSVGVCTSFRENEFDTIILGSFWQRYEPDIFRELAREGLRIAKTVLLVEDIHMRSSWVGGTGEQWSSNRMMTELHDVGMSTTILNVSDRETIYRIVAN